MNRLRMTMSDGAVTVSSIARRWQRGDHVCVKTEGIDRTGVVVRARNESFTVALDGGGRCYASRRQLFPIVVACDVQEG